MELGTLPGFRPSRHGLALAGIDLFEAARPALRVLAASEVVVVLSRSRDPEREVHLERCLADGVPVVVRPSGGGAVVLAPGVVTASLVASAPGATPERGFERHCAAVAAALADCGCGGAERRGVSDLCFADRKVAGSSLRLFRSLVLFQVAVLVDLDVGVVERYLPMPSRRPAYRHDRGHRAFLTTLAEQGFTGPVTAVEDALRARLGGVDGATGAGWPGTEG